MIIRWLIQLLNSGTLSGAQNGVLLIAPPTYGVFFKNASTILLSRHPFTHKYDDVELRSFILPAESYEAPLCI